MRGVRSVVATLLAVAAAGVLAGCDPYGYAYPEGTADIDIFVGADGTAITEIYFDGHERSEAELLDAARAAAHIFTDPDARPDISINGNSGGYAFAVVTTERTFAPGPKPVIAFDTTQAVKYLLDQGITSVDVYWSGMEVPTTPQWHPEAESYGSDGGSWDAVTDAANAPRGTVTLHPDPTVARAYGSVLGPLAGLVALAVGVVCLMSRRHRLAATLGVGALAGSVVGLAADGYDDTAALAASGGPAWPFALFSPLLLATLLVTIPTASLVTVLGLNKVPHPYVIFNPPPRWAEVEPGWLPFPGWWPNMSWPAAPSDWAFLIEVPRRAAKLNRSRRARAAARNWVQLYNEAARRQGEAER